MQIVRTLAVCVCFSACVAPESESATLCDDVDITCHLELDRTHPLILHDDGRVKDTESLAYCQGQGKFWIGDDKTDAIHQFSTNGHLVDFSVTGRDLRAEFPDATMCGNINGRTCYTGELETVACDKDTLYVVNTVNNSG